MEAGIVKNWKTTLIGVLAGFIPLGQGILQGLAMGQHFDWSKIGIGAGIMALGAVAKDLNVTGGSVSQPTVSNPPSIAEQK
jgi:hypothetical protein